VLSPYVMEQFASGAETSPGATAPPPTPAEGAAPVSARFVPFEGEAEAKERRSREPSRWAYVLPPVPVQTPIGELTAPLREFTRGSE
jgi:hypothetical protein